MTSHLLESLGPSRITSDSVVFAITNVSRSPFNVVLVRCKVHLERHNTANPGLSMLRVNRGNLQE